MKKIAIFLILFLLLSFALPMETVESANTIPVGVYYYLWYGFDSNSSSWTGGNRTSHWNDSASGIVLDYPTSGYYSSMDNNTLKNHLFYIQYCGIDFIIVSWWGWGVYNFSKPNDINKNYEAFDNATFNLFKYLKATNSQIKVALLVENFNSSSMDWTQTYNYILTKYYNPYSAWIFNWHGKPLLLSFNPLTLQANNSFTTRTVGSPPNHYDWNFWRGMDKLESYSGNFDSSFYTGNPEISSDGVVTVIPRYDDKALYDAGSRTTFMQFDRTFSKGLYDEEWRYLCSMKDSIRLVLIYSWNENHERSAIEPLIYYGDSGRDQTYLVELTRKEVSSFESYVPPINTSPITTTITMTETTTLTTTITSTITFPSPNNTILSGAAILIAVASTIIAVFLIVSIKRKPLKETVT